MNEKYEFTYRNTAGDFFKFYIGNIYSQWAGIANVVFTVAIAALIFSRWSSSSEIFRAIMIFALLIFPVLQPLALWLRGIRSAEEIEPETTLRFDSGGMEIQVKDHRQRIGWNRSFSAVKRPGLIVVSPDGTHAYLIPDRATGAQKEPFFDFLQKKTQH